MTKPTIHWKTVWYHGTRTHIVTFSAVSDAEQGEIEAAADGEGYERDGEFWTPPAGPNDFFEIARLKGFDLEFGREDEDGPLNLHRLYPTDETRNRLEATPDFTLWKLAGYCPVQAERWVLARLRNEQFFSLVDLNIRISALIEDLNTRTMRRYGKSRRALFDEVERSELKPLPSTPFEYAEWKTAKVHPDYHIEVEKTFYSVPHGLIGKRVDVRLTYRTVEIFFDHRRVASHIRSSQRSGHVTVNQHMPKAHQRYANTTPHTLRREAAKVGANTATFIERLLSDRPHPEQGYRSAQGVLSLARRYQSDRLERACERALIINALSYSSVANILRSGLDQAPAMSEAVKPAPPHGNIRGKTYYQ
ncbi:transposase [Rhizobium leguminosarum]|nr:transposase [Rhizobium leguminosarum]